MFSVHNSNSESDDDIFEGMNVDEDTKRAVVTYVKRRLAPQPVKIRADIEVTCFTYEGIDAIKEALLEGESKSVSEAPVKIKLIAPPMYVMTTMTLDKEIGVDTLNKAIEAIAVLIRAKGLVVICHIISYHIPSCHMTSAQPAPYR